MAMLFWKNPETEFAKENSLDVTTRRENDW